MHLKGYLYIIAAATLWGIIGPVSKFAFSEGLAPMEVAFWRAVLAWGFFGIHALITNQVRINWRDLPAMVFFAVFGVTLFYATYQLAVNEGGAALAAVLLYTAPAWVTLMSRFFFKESITPLKLIALLLTLAGVGSVSLSTGELTAQISYPALLSGLSAGFCYSLYYIFGKHFSGRYTSPNLFLYILPMGALGIYPWVSFCPKTAMAWVALTCLAALSTYGAYYFYYKALRYLEASKAAITATLEPVIAAVTAFWWWNESFTPKGYVGSILILTAVLMVVWDGMRRKPGTKPSG
jgi:DME family drug/metabolite transporter